MVTEDGHSTSRYEPVPLALWMIAIATIAPFPVLAAAYGWGAADIARPALSAILTWTAVVLAFLGGVRWGLESGRPRPRLYRLLISIASPVAAWGLLLARHRIADYWVIGGCIAAFLIQWLFDHQAPDVPARYPRLSTTMTAAACISLAICLDQAIRGQGLVIP
jgi:hypothetical protein